MKHTDKPWDTRLRSDALSTTVLHRNRPVVIGLTVLTSALLIAGGLTSRLPGIACYVAAGLAGIVLMAYLFSKRLRVTRPPR